MKPIPISTQRYVSRKRVFSPAGHATEGGVRSFAGEQLCGFGRVRPDGSGGLSPFQNRLTHKAGEGIPRVACPEGESSRHRDTPPRVASGVSPANNCVVSGGLGPMVRGG